MKTLKYYVLDVFTDERYKGNQLSVVYVDEELPIENYHNIAREFGYSETSFVHYSTKENTFKVRSFTPAKFEVVGAGHNLLGAVCLALLKKWDIFRTQGNKPYVLIGDMRIPLNIAEAEGLPFVGMKQKQAEILRPIPIEPVTNALGLIPVDIDPNFGDITIVQTEVPHLMIPVRDLEALQRAACNKAELKAISDNFGFEGYYLFTTHTVSDRYVAESRFFNPGIGIDEDPATGTAAGPLAGYLQMLGHIKKNQEYLILQGKYVDQPSVIRVNVADDGIWVSGSSIIVMEGDIYV